MKPWRVFAWDVHIDIAVTPEGGKPIDMRLFLGIYNQKCGTCSGTLMDASGERHEGKDSYAAGEYADILWSGNASCFVFTPSSNER